MVITTTTTLLKAEDLWLLPDPELPRELWRGVLRPPMPGQGPHGAVGMRLAVPLGSYVYAADLGAMFGEATDFILERDPDTVYCPDLAFVSRARLPAGGIGPGLLELVPDLAVEILSPSNRRGEIQQKVATYLRVGVRAVWVVDPRRRTARIFTADGRELLLTESDELDGGDVVPGFRCPLSALFADLRS